MNKLDSKPFKNKLSGKDGSSAKGHGLAGKHDWDAGKTGNKLAFPTHRTSLSYRSMFDGTNLIESENLRKAIEEEIATEGLKPYKMNNGTFRDAYGRPTDEKGNPIKTSDSVDFGKDGPPPMKGPSITP